MLAWALMAIGEMLGLRWMLWQGSDEMPAHVLHELERILRCVLQP